MTVIPSLDPSTGLTMSGLERAEKCPASEALPHPLDLSFKPFASRGSVVHNFLKDVSLVGREEALSRVPAEHAAACAAIEVDKLPAVQPDAYAVEVGFAYDWENDTAREINRSEADRNYGAKPTEIAGRADIVGLSEQAVFIGDYKTGYRYLGEASDSLQLRGYALAAARAWGRDAASVAFIRLRDDGSPWYLHGELDAMDLDETAARIRSLVAKVERAKSLSRERLERELVTGDHCTYCPAWRMCPAQIGLMTDLVAASAFDLDEIAPTNFLTAETAPPFDSRIRLMEKVLQRAKDIRDDFARKYGPIPRSKTLVYGETEWPTEAIDPIQGEAVLVSEFGHDAARDCIKLSAELTKASLDRGLRKHHERKRLSAAHCPTCGGTGRLILREGLEDLCPACRLDSVNKMKTRALDKLREVGAAVTTHKRQMREHKPKEAAEEAET